MDLDPELKKAVTVIRDSLHHYAQSKDWKVEDYRVTMEINTDWGAITIVLFCRSFQENSPLEMELYDEIMDHLERDLEPIAGLYESTYLLIRPLDEYPNSGSKNPIENYVEVDDGFLNPNVKHEKLRGSIVGRL
jgi:hypothetical protein